MLSASTSTSTSANNLSDEATWAAFKAKRTNVDLYTDNAVIMYVPTSVGVRGCAQIRKFFLHPQFSQKVNPVQETVYNTVQSNHQLIEEATWSIHFHSGECKWLLPHTEERYLMNATIKFPITTSVSFDEDNHKIKSIRYFWDQACVLKQLRVISDRVQWPVVGEQQVEVLRSPQTVQLKGLNDEAIDLDHQKTQKDQNKNQFKPGRVFGAVDPKDEVRRSVRRAEPNSPPARNIFTYAPPVDRPLVAPSNKLNSSFSFTHDDGSANKISAKLSQTNMTQSKSLPAGKVTPKIPRNIFG